MLRCILVAVHAALARRLQRIFLAKNMVLILLFEPNWTAASTGHLDDTTGAAWRREVILVLLFFLNLEWNWVDFFLFSVLRSLEQLHVLENITRD